MHSDGRSDEIDDGVRVRIHGRAGNILVPKIVAAEGTKSVEAGALSRAHCAASALGRRPSQIRRNPNRPNRCLQIRFREPLPPLPEPLRPMFSVEPVVPPPQFAQASASASAAVAASSLFQEKFMPLLSQETAGKPCDVRPCPAENRDMYS